MATRADRSLMVRDAQDALLTMRLHGCPRRKNLSQLPADLGIEENLRQGKVFILSSGLLAASRRMGGRAPASWFETPLRGSSP
jgi:hypothetical protein